MSTTAPSCYANSLIYNHISNPTCPQNRPNFELRVGNTYVEVKTILHLLAIDIPDYVKTKKVPPLLTVDRMIKHLTALGNSLQKNQRAILLMCFIHDSHFFDVPVNDDDVSYNKVRKTIDENIAKGVEMWQVNFEITPTNVMLKQYFQLRANAA